MFKKVIEHKKVKKEPTNTNYESNYLVARLL
jgi:hypothetical protein